MPRVLISVASVARGDYYEGQKSLRAKHKRAMRAEIRPRLCLTPVWDPVQILARVRTSGIFWVPQRIYSK